MITFNDQIDDSSTNTNKPLLPSSIDFLDHLTVTNYANLRKMV